MLQQVQVPRHCPSNPLVSYRLPKAEMHTHISMACPNWLVEEKQDAIENEALDCIFDNKQKRYYPDLSNFHATYEALNDFVQTEEDLMCVTKSYLTQIAAEGCIYAEISNSFRNESRFETQIEILTTVIDEVKEETGLETRIVATSLRNHGAIKAEAMADYLSFKKNDNAFRYVTGFGLVGDEGVDSIAEYKQAFHKAWHEAGLGLTPHVGEQYVENVIDFLGAVPDDALKIKSDDHRRLRVGHGTLTYLSTALLDIYADHDICFEVCLSANKRIGLPSQTRNLRPNMVVGEDSALILNQKLRQYYNALQNHPLPVFVERGISVCLGSDNPFLMNTSIGKEYALAVKNDLQQEGDLIQFTRHAIEHGNMESATRRKLLEKVSQYQHNA